MQTVQQIVPISDFRIDQDTVLKMMDKEPVILAQRSKARAVLVSVDQWNAMVKKLEERRFTETEIRAIAKAYQKMAGERDMVDGEDLKAMMAERYGHVANKV